MSNAILDLGEIPVWRGLSEAPGNYISLPFNLEQTESGLLAQAVSSDIEEAVINHYADDNYGFITKPPGFSDWASSLGDQLVDFALSLLRDKRNARVLEIGAGNLYVAERICQRADVQKYTVIDPAINELSDDVRIEVVKSYFSEPLPGEYDVVFSFNCLEHIPQPEVFLGNVASMRSNSDDTMLVGLVFPDVTAQLERHDLNAFIHEHINYFTRDSLHTLAVNSGLEIARLDSAQDEFRVVLEVPVTSQAGVLSDDWPCFDLSVLSDMSVARPLELLVQALRDNKTVALHGACNGLNLLMHFWDRENLDRLKLFDGDQSKAGLYLPTLPIPVMHSSDPSYADVDVVLVAAVTFFDPIKRDLVTSHGIAEEKIIPLFSNPNEIKHER